MCLVPVSEFLFALPFLAVCEVLKRVIRICPTLIFRCFSLDGSALWCPSRPGDLQAISRADRWRQGCGKARTIPCSTGSRARRISSLGLVFFSLIIARGRSLLGVSSRAGDLLSASSRGEADAGFRVLEEARWPESNMC